MKSILKIICGAAIVVIPALAEQHVITQKDRTFSQVAISIRQGESIVFKNADDVTHNVFSVSPGMEFDIRRQAPGASSSVPFPREGVAVIRCSIYPGVQL